jgi:hypothetical protein
MNILFQLNGLLTHTSFKIILSMSNLDVNIFQIIQFMKIQPFLYYIEAPKVYVTSI